MHLHKTDEYKSLKKLGVDFYLLTKVTQSHVSTEQQLGAAKALITYLVDEVDEYVKLESNKIDISIIELVMRSGFLLADSNEARNIIIGQCRSFRLNTLADTLQHVIDNIKPLTK